MSKTSGALIAGLSLNLAESGPAGDKLSGVCPRCKSEKASECLQVDPEERTYFCFAAQQGGDFVELVAHVYGVRQYEAQTWLIDHSFATPLEAAKITNPFD